MFLFAFEHILFCIAGVLITGGNPIATSDTAELYLPSSAASCKLPKLPVEYNYSRVLHSADDEGLLCGGLYTANTCLQWSPDTGSWEAAVTLDVWRADHISWTPANGRGTYLIGGISEAIPYPVGERTTTLITPDGTQKPGFPLKYDAL